MKNRIFATIAASFLAVALATPAFSASKEIIQLQTQVQAIQDQLSRLQQSLDERMGVMRNLVEQSTDNVNKLNGTIAEMQKSLQQTHSDYSTRSDQLSGQVQALNDTVDELKARLTRISKQLDDMQSAQQNLNPGAPGQPGTTAGSPAQGQAPPPETLYNNALRDYNSGNNQLAGQEFSDYLKYYPATDLAGNAAFYLADIQYRQGNFEQAVQSYDRVLQQYPGGNKSAAAQLKKGYALLELGRKDDGVRELNALITRYPRSIEAQQARDRLRKLGVTPSTSARRQTAQ
ncbi:MAG TPA: tetratricopeptide repeat protein [Terriglobales bacterium]|nr:tetratricopeptide repeat protein [Terriglobales bacterium]